MVCVPLDGVCVRRRTPTASPCLYAVDNDAKKDNTPISMVMVLHGGLTMAARFECLRVAAQVAVVACSCSVLAAVCGAVVAVGY